jgi:hypothetical protein
MRLHEHEIRAQSTPVAFASRSVRPFIAAMLELWVAAGLLRLSADASWTAIGTAAALIAVRTLLARATSV